MIQQYISRQLLAKNRGIYFKKGKWIFHVLAIALIWLITLAHLNTNLNTTKKMGEVKFTLNGNISIAGLLTMLPFLAFFYFYCLYLIPVCFKQNHRRKFWMILIGLLLIIPWMDMGYDHWLEQYFQVLIEKKTKLTTIKLIIDTYDSFFSEFMGFTAVLYLMELMEGIRTVKETDFDQRLLAYTELQLIKTQMNPDFMIRSLDGIIHLSEQKDNRASDAVVHFSDVLRYRLYRSKQKQVSLTEELEQLQTLFQFQNTIPGQENIAMLDINGEPHQQLIPPLSLINIAEPLLTTFEPDSSWSMLFYLLIEEEELQIAIELTSTNDSLVNARLAALQADLQRLWGAALNFNPDQDKTTYSLRLCLPVSNHSNVLS